MNMKSRNFGRLIMQLRQLERHPRSFGNAGALTPSEIHTIDAIGNKDGIIMSELADRLGVTKGAVTQLVGRLEAKELIIRTPHPEDSRSFILSLTEKGKNAYKAHEQLHLDFYKHLNDLLSQEEIAIFEKAVEKLIAYLQQLN